LAEETHIREEPQNPTIKTSEEELATIFLTPLFPPMPPQRETTAKRKPIRLHLRRGSGTLVVWDIPQRLILQKKKNAELKNHPNETNETKNSEKRR
jgi:hypothetical protein